jgi:hypothetical protein
MDPRKQLLATLSAIALSAGGLTYAAPALAQEQVAQDDRCEAPTDLRTEEECACEAALNRNTIEALEEFLRRYPPRPGGETTACTALALAALDQFRPDNDREPPDNPPYSN